MLERLNVKNFAIIEDLTVDFSSGMTVLTGETGAGKSLIIDTISLLLGARADSDMIRYGEKSASICGIFTRDNSVIDELLIKYEIPSSDKITILREIADSGKNVIKINNRQITLSMLKNISVHLADIHIQNDTYKLFNPDSYLLILDPKNDSKFDKLLADYLMNYSKYLEELKEYNHIKEGKKQALDKLEFLKYECDELSNLNLYENIDVELEEKIAKLSNYDKIFSSLNEAYNTLNSEMNGIDSLYNASKSIEKIASYDSKYKDYCEKLLDSYYISSEIKEDIYNQIESLDFDEDELNQSIDKLNEIEHAKTKYKKSVSELISYLNEITIEIEMVTNYDELFKEHEEKCKSLFNKALSSGLKLSEYRKKISLKMASQIEKECKELDLDNTIFNIKFNEINCSDFTNKDIFHENGIDEIEFMISFNKGEPLKPLHKVASGGEMSRIMLAFKSYLSVNTDLSLMVFDEIDTGVSGATAKKIAIKMHQISKYVQVLCITHLPQVASFGDQHKHIYKELIDGRTKTRIEDLSYDRRVEEIAMMLSGDKLSMYALEHAKSLLSK